MTRKGFRGVNIYESIYNEAEKFIWLYNAKHGYKKIRSMAHLVEIALSEYLEKHKKEIEDTEK